jgi:hypothetical protein
MPLLADRAPITGRVKDARGFLTCAARVSRIGVQRYLRQELGLAGNGVVGVLRPSESIYSDASLRSFEGALVTAGHPPGGVSSRSWRHWSIGHVLGLARKAEDGRHVAATLQIVDSGAVSAIERGGAGLSVGYNCSLRHEPGRTPDGEPYEFVMGDVVVDHVAVVPADQARCGPTCTIADSVTPASACACGGTCGAHPPALLQHGSRSMTDRRAVIVDGKVIETDAAAADAIEALTARLAQQQPFAAGQRIDFRDARFADALRRGAADAFNERARAMHDESTPYGRYVKALKDGWKPRAA